MNTPSKEKEHIQCACPLCAAWDSYKDSDVAKHVDGVKREALMLARSVLDAAIRKSEEHLAAAKSKVSGTKPQN